MLLKTWLESLGMNNVKNCIVTLTNGRRKQHTMVGCIYNNPKIGNQVYIYCLGDYASVPLKSTSKTTALYRDDIQDDAFIIAAYTNDGCLGEPYKTYHPFGHNILLCPVTRQFTDNCERKLVGKIIIK